MQYYHCFFSLGVPWGGPTGSGQIAKYLMVDKTIILDKTSSQREDLLVCLVLCLVVAVFLERTEIIRTGSENLYDIS